MKTGTREFEVNCINKPSRTGEHEHITYIGHLGHSWWIRRESAIARIEAGDEAFYTLDRATGKRAYIEVVREHGKVSHLRTHADGEWTDDLLAQNMCVDCRIVI